LAGSAIPSTSTGTSTAQPIDDAGLPLAATVYDQSYDNAFWDGQQWCSATAAALQPLHHLHRRDRA
jgi:hypothetical protein